jgi:hypothetical protein
MPPEIGWLLRRLAAKRVPPAVGEVQCIPIEYNPPKFLSKCSERIRVLSRGAFNYLGSFFQQRLDWPYILIPILCIHAPFAADETNLVVA